MVAVRCFAPVALIGLALCGGACTYAPDRENRVDSATGLFEPWLDGVRRSCTGTLDLDRSTLSAGCSTDRGFDVGYDDTNGDLVAPAVGTLVFDTGTDVRPTTLSVQFAQPGAAGLAVGSAIYEKGSIVDLDDGTSSAWFPLHLIHVYFPSQTVCNVFASDPCVDLPESRVDGAVMWANDLAQSVEQAIR